MSDVKSVRSHSGALVLLLATNFVLRALVAVRPLETIDRLTIPDDAYLALHLARSIAHGIGPFYGTALTNGFQPLFVFLCVPAFWLFPGDLAMPVHFALLLLSIFDTAALYFLFRIINQEGSHPVSPFIAGVLWLLSPYVLKTSSNGLETMMASCLMLALFCYYRAYVALSNGPCAGPAMVRIRTRCRRFHRRQDRQRFLRYDHTCPDSFASSSQSRICWVRPPRGMSSPDDASLASLFLLLYGRSLSCQWYHGTIPRTIVRFSGANALQLVFPCSGTRNHHHCARKLASGCLPVNPHHAFDRRSKTGRSPDP